MLSSYNTILAGKRVVLDRMQSRATEGDVGADARVEALLDDIEKFTGERDFWAMETVPDDPQLWVTAYSRLLRTFNALVDRIEDNIDTVAPKTKARLLSEDLPMLRARIQSQRARLAYWMRASTKE
jgi:hypothetical protein